MHLYRVFILRWLRQLNVGRRKWNRSRLFSAVYFHRLKSAMTSRWVKIAVCFFFLLLKFECISAVIYSHFWVMICCLLLIFAVTYISALLIVLSAYIVIFILWSIVSCSVAVFCVKASLNPNQTNPVLLKIRKGEGWGDQIWF